MSASQATLDLLTDYYAAMETSDPLRYGTYYAEGMTLTFGNSPTITGRQNVIGAFAEVLGKVRSLHHDLVNVWEQDRRSDPLRVRRRLESLRREKDLDQRLHGADGGRREVHGPEDLRR